MPYQIFPRPQSIQYPGGTVLTGELPFIRDESLPEQGYKILLTENAQEIYCADAPGERYARQTLAQILGHADFQKTAGLEAECVIIEDAPAILRRGVQLDISRCKVPTLETLFRVVDILSGMRINELQLYIEGYSYAYEGWEESFPGETPVSREELARLRAYAAERFITLIPNMNCFGHMDAWLALPELNRLAECPDGFPFQGLYHRAAGTVDPNDGEAFDFVRGLCDDLLRGFGNPPEGEQPPMFNANLDEPFELGMGKSREAVEQGGKISVYSDYVNKLNDYINAKGFDVMIWGDVVYAHPESVGLLPGNITLLDWLYEGAGRFERRAKIASEAGFRFYVCPGTSSWRSFLGRSGNMKENILDAADTARRFGAYGLMVTDWGDNGHWQYLPVSYPGYAFAAAYSWNPHTGDGEIFNYLDEHVFRDASRRFSRLLYELGDYYKEEKSVSFNTTEAFYLMTCQYPAPTSGALDEALETLAKKNRFIAEENGIPY
ncbi:MAG: family 20 glycosylhydrolase, partial [Clostridiales bacterium]|nr:family 20 glycosylhydrolase [Clostridiales bacterium]